MSDMLEKIDKYFSENSKEKILEDWKKSEKYDKVGITVSEFVNNNSRIETAKLRKKQEMDIKMFGVFVLNKVRDAYNKPQNITLIIEDEFKKYKKEYLKKIKMDYKYKKVYMINNTMIVRCNRIEKPIFKSELYLKWISEMEFYRPFNDAEQNKIVEFLSKDYALFNSKNDTDFLLDISNGIETDRVSISPFAKNINDTNHLHVFFNKYKKVKEIEGSPLFDEILSEFSVDESIKLSKALYDYAHPKNDDKKN